jgi:hypothetical protein
MFIIIKDIFEIFYKNIKIMKITKKKEINYLQRVKLNVNRFYL